MLALLAAALLKAPTGDAFAAFAAYMKAHPKFSVDLLINGSTRCLVTVERPGRLRFDMKDAGLDYTFVRDGNRSLEISRLDRLYCEGIIGGRLPDFESLLSDQADAFFPHAILVDDLHRFLNAGKLTVTKSNSGTKLLVTDPQGHGTEVAIVAPDGKLLRYEFHAVGDAGRIDRAFVFSNYRPVAPGRFYVAPPRGFTSYFLPMTELPLEPGSAISLGTAVNASGQRVDLDGLARRGKLLVAVLDLSQDPGQRAAQHLAELRGLLGNSASLVALGNRAEEIESIEFLSSPTEFTRLSRPGTPLYYLLDHGRVQRAWMGDEDATRAAMFNEIAEAAKLTKS